MDAEFLPAGIDRATLKPLARRSDRAGLTRLAGHSATLAGTGALVLLAAGQPVLLVPAMALHGAVLMFLFAPLHETIHRTAFRSRTLNDAVAFVCGLFLLLPPDYFRAFHFAHHRWTQDPARDPELAGGGRPATRAAFLLYLTGLPYWAWQARVLCRHASGRVDAPFITPAQRLRIVREARLVLGLYGAGAAASVLFASPLLLVLWIGPALLGQPWLRAFLAAEHMLCPLTPEMERNTRTTLTAAPLRYYGWNMNYHAEHHLAPALPFHALPAAHEALRPNLQMTSPGYASVLREVWAAAAQRRGTSLARQEPR
jgi:fatty acid desaturase